MSGNKRSKHSPVDYNIMAVRKRCVIGKRYSYVRQKQEFALKYIYFYKCIVITGTTYFYTSEFARHCCLCIYRFAGGNFAFSWISVWVLVEALFVLIVLGSLSPYKGSLRDGTWVLMQSPQCLYSLMPMIWLYCSQRPVLNESSYANRCSLLCIYYIQKLKQHINRSLWFLNIILNRKKKHPVLLFLSWVLQYKK